MGETNSAAVAARLEVARKDLLDLTFRNPLLNYRLLKARGLEVVDAAPADVYRLLVHSAKKLHFAATGAESSIDDEDVGTELALALYSDDAAPDPINQVSPDENRRTRTSPLELQTPHPTADLQKRLLNTYYTARTFIEEQGINTLYLALGMLRWYEDDNGQQERKSPLLLVPVELERGAAGDRFHMKFHEQEIGDNTSLAALMFNEHGIQFPVLAAAEDLDVAGYFSQIETLIGRKKRWRVDSSAVALGFFSFSKYLMYKDLEALAWPEERQPCDHPTLQALLGNGFHDPPSEIASDANLDAIVKVADTHTVMDADSSQSVAVLDVVSGRSMVIQGPPGTGKSQTITNIIAESLARGKRILFVAEKMAALDVVKDRLSNLELGDACLEIHSNKSNKKLVLQDLQRTLSLNQPVLGSRDDDAFLLQSAQDRLNAYAESVNSPVGKSWMTVQEVFGEHLASGGAITNPNIPRINLGIGSSWTPIEYKQRELIVRELQAQLARMGAPKGHLFWGSEREAYLPTDAEHVRSACVVARAKAVELRSAADKLAAELRIGAPIRIADAAMIAQVLRRAIEAPRHEGVLLGTTAWVTRRSDIDSLLDLGQEVVSLRATCDKTFQPESLAAHVLELRQAIQETGPHWWHILSSRWRAAQKTFESLRKNADSPVPFDAQIKALDTVIAFQTAKADFDQKQKLGSDLFGVQWQGEHSNWQALGALTTWVSELIKDIQGGKLPKSVIDFFKGNPDLFRFAPELNAVELLISETRAACAKVTAAIVLNEAIRFGERGELTGLPFNGLLSLLSGWTESSEKLSEIARFNHMTRECAKIDLSTLVEEVKNRGIEAANLSAVFRQSYVWALMQTAFTEHHGLGNFSGTSHEQLIAEFRALDVKHLKNNRAKIARVHWDDLPNLSADGQLRVLKREFEKKARHMPLRKLLVEAGRAIQAIKPVFMMSPLSVAAYLSPGSLDFDIVIFDEASQVRPVDAFGAVLRARQAVVVGDSRQLPPTSFFDTITNSDQVNEDDVTSDLESILGLFVAQGAPERMLKWHYRSRHESLIAVSNQEFYDNSLVIFPSPDSARENYGLHYHYLPNTIYDRGKSSTNRDEAKVVAEHVMAHVRRQMARPENEWQSLGVAAFSMTQMQAVLDAVEMLRRQHPECESFFAPSRREPFFVKNLENVQGDERDVIYISVGYGRDGNGKVSMNFGPLNGEGGARRLNVLITRAKLRCEVFTNLTADDIEVATSSSAGLKAFKNFLQYAQTGNLAMSVPSGREPDSPFEREVIRLLRSMNYNVVAQVGCAGYFIDMAVTDPQRPGRYLIGIECDGRTYHSARSARDRDRLREQVLRGQGWYLHHIWSTDWIRQPAEEARRLKAAIELANAAKRGAESIASETAGSTAVSSLNGNPGDHVETVVRVAAIRETKDIPHYACAELPNAYQISGGYYAPNVMADLVTKVVATESPVHINEVARRIAECAGIGRVSDKLKSAVDLGAVIVRQNGKMDVRGSFCWSPGMVSPKLRNRESLGTASRKLELVAPEEIQEAIKHCLEESYGMPIDELPKSVVRLLLGFERLSQENRDIILAQVYALDESGHLWMNDGQVALAG